MTARALSWLAAAMFLAPFAIPYHWLPSTLFVNNWVMLALVALPLFGVAVQRLRFPAAPLELPVSSALAGALILVLLLQHFHGRLAYLQFLLIPAFVIGTASFASWMGSQGRDEPRPVLNAIAIALIVGAVAQVTAVVVQVSGFDIVAGRWMARPEVVTEPFRATGLVAHSNMLAAYLTWSLLAIAYLMFGGRLNPWAATGLAVPIAVALALTGSRSVYLYLGLIGPLWSVLLRRSGSPRAWWIGAAAPACYLAVDVAVRTASALLSEDGLAMRSMAVTAGEPRLALIGDALKVFAQWPWLGAGWGNFAAARFALEAPCRVELNNDHAHNVFAHLLAETGLLGAALSAAGVLLLLARGRGSLPKNLEQQYAWAMIGVTALYSLIEFPLWTPLFLLPTAFMVGMVLERPYRLPISRSASICLGLAGLTLAGTTVLAALDYARVDRAYADFFLKGRVHLPEKYLQLSSHSLFRYEAEQLYLRARRFDPFLLAIDGPIAERVARTSAAPEFIAIAAPYRALGGDIDGAVRDLRILCSEASPSCDSIMAHLESLAEEFGGPLSELSRSVSRERR